jgi:RNA polymerase sigma-70 factor (ECF subfamily)
LLFQLRNGRAEGAWDMFVSTYAPLVYRYCRQHGLQDADAQDVTQIVLLKVRKFEYHPERGQFRGWLATVTRHAVERVWRQAGRNGQGLGGDGFEEVVRHTPAGAEGLNWDRLYNARILEAAVERIRPEFPADAWEAFLAVALRVQDGPDGKRWVWGNAADARQVAERLGRPVGWVYKVKHKVSRRLVEEIAYLAEEVGLLV